MIAFSPSQGIAGDQIPSRKSVRELREPKAFTVGKKSRWKAAETISRAVTRLTHSPVSCLLLNTLEQVLSIDIARRSETNG
jgi:hypothetical protein